MEMHTTERRTDRPALMHRIDYRKLRLTGQTLAEPLALDVRHHVI